jgi:hypothetical protein
VFRHPRQDVRSYLWLSGRTEKVLPTMMFRRLPALIPETLKPCFAIG